MSISSDPSVLAAASRCFDTCVAPGEGAALSAYLISQIAGGSTDPSTLANASSCIRSCIPQQMNAAAQTYLLAVLAGGSTDPKVLLSAATCFRSCVPMGGRRALVNYALAQKAAGVTDASLLANAARCFSSCTEKGSQQDVITYLLASKAGVPTDASLANAAKCFASCIPDGSQLDVQAYLAVNWANSSPVVPPLTPAQQAVANFNTSVLNNGGPAISVNTTNCLITFWTAIQGLLPKVKTMNCFVPDSLNAALTPFIVGVGNNPYTIVGPGAWTIDVNGILGQAGNNALNTGVNPSTAFASINDAGVSFYDFTSSSTANENFGCQVNANSMFKTYDTFTAQVEYFFAFGAGAGGSWSNNIGSGAFICDNRVDANNIIQYDANSGRAFEAHTTVSSTAGTSLPNLTCYFGALNNNGAAGPTVLNKASFLAIHTSLTALEAQTLFNAVQALRVCLGGGFN